VYVLGNITLEIFTNKWINNCPDFTYTLQIQNEDGENYATDYISISDSYSTKLKIDIL